MDLHPELSFFPGETVEIIAPGIMGMIKEVKIFEDYRILYSVRYWANSDLYAADFTDIELKHVTPHEPTTIGFRNEYPKIT